MLFLNQISSQTLGEISFSIKVSRCWVRSVPLVRNMPFKEDTCFLPDCPKRLSFSLELLQDVPSSSWDLECAVTLCHDLVKVCFTQTWENVRKSTFTWFINSSFTLLFRSVWMKCRWRGTCRSSDLIYPTQVSSVLYYKHVVCLSPTLFKTHICRLSAESWVM